MRREKESLIIMFLFQLQERMTHHLHPLRRVILRQLITCQWTFRPGLCYLDDPVPIFPSLYSSSSILLPSSSSSNHRALLGRLFRVVPAADPSKDQSEDPSRGRLSVSLSMMSTLQSVPPPHQPPLRSPSTTVTSSSCTVIIPAAAGASPPVSASTYPGVIVALSLQGSNRMVIIYWVKE